MLILKNWTQIARSQTAAAVIMLCGVFYLLGGGILFTVFGLLLIIFSITAHDFSFAHNSVIDVLTGYDTRDRFKNHFPLCNGRVNPFNALKMTHLGMVMTTFFAIFLCFMGPGNKFYAMACYAVFIISGFWYNEWTSKIALWDFVPISLCFTSLSLYAYFLVNNTLNTLVVLCAVYIFLVEWYEIGVAGEIKEYEMMDEVSLLRQLGAEPGTVVFNLGLKAFFYALSVKTAGLVVLALIVYEYNFCLPSVLIFLLMGTGMLFFAWRLTKPQKRDRDKSLRYMASEEILSIFALPLILIPIIDMTSTVFLIFFSFFYFVLMNKMNWGTWVKPRV
jgi:hypothetical protein